MTTGRERLAELVRQARNPNVNPNDLPDIITEIAGWTFDCARLEAQAHAEYLEAERDRKYQFAKVKMRLMNENKSSAARAESEAELDPVVIESRIAEVKAQAQRLELKAMLDGARDVMDAARTKVSWLKNERSHSA